MRFFTKFSFSFLLLVTCYLLLVTPNVHAQGEFETDYKVTYFVNNDGITDVTQDITLKNKTPNNYADKFELKIGSTKVENVSATDNVGPMETSVKFEDNITAISLKFNQKVIGIDKINSWQLKYTSQELATKAGQIWEISIPRLAKNEDIGLYETTINVPTVFGPIAFAVPPQESFQKLGLRQEFKFSKEQLFNSGIAMSFGEKQIFSFDLKYYLENNNLTAQTAQVALPPDNNYQKVVFENINPPPLNVTIDNDGNFLAKFKLGPRKRLEVNASGYVEVFSKPFRKITKSLTKEQKELYTQPQRYWETDNAFIKEKAQVLTTPKEIYDFVSTFLIYSQERLNLPKINRKGAATAITFPQDSVCMEFTDLFVAIARSAGIPAREVNGYAFTQNERLRPLSLTVFGGDVLHAWPEYWDDELGWVQIDPTWGATSGGLDYFNKLDFNHITFVERGLSSTYPFPAGAYKTQDKLGTSTVNINFANQLPNAVSNPSLSLIAPDKIISGVPVKINSILTNLGSTSIINQELLLTTSKLKDLGKFKDPSDENKTSISQKIPILPPFSKYEYVFELQTEGLFKQIDDTIVLSFAESEISQPVKILPFYKAVLSPTVAVVIFLASAIITSGLLLYKKLHTKKSRAD